MLTPLGQDQRKFQARSAKVLLMRVEAGERPDQEQQASGAGNEPQATRKPGTGTKDDRRVALTPVASAGEALVNGICSPSNRRMTD